MRDEAQIFRETCRYAGLKGAWQDEVLEAKIRRCIRSLEEAVRERYARRFLGLTLSGSDITMGDASVSSGDLSANLSGCERVCLFAVTLGPEVDRLIRRASLTDMAEAALYQAAGAALAEDLADRVNEQIRQEAKALGFSLRPRFSPGYGDFSLGFQRSFSRLLNLPSSCGIYLTATCLMTPSKSITAVAGLYRGEEACAPGGCTGCGRSADCPYARTD